jgi:hypothetical protein
MPVKVNIPISHFEYRADFAHARISLLADRAAIIQTLFEAFTQWGITADSLEPISTGKTSEQGMKIVLQAKKTTMFFGVSHCTFANDDSDWSRAEEIIGMLATLTEILKKEGKVEFANQKTTVSLHLQPVDGRFIELIRPFLSPALISLGSGELKTGATVIRWSNNERITLDGSGRLANAMFVAFEQQFNGHDPFDEMAYAIREMEDKIFGLIGVEEAK